MIRAKQSSSPASLQSDGASWLENRKGIEIQIILCSPATRGVSLKKVGYGPELILLHKHHTIPPPTAHLPLEPPLSRDAIPLEMPGRPASLVKARGTLARLYCRIPHRRALGIHFSNKCFGRLPFCIALPKSLEKATSNSPLLLTQLLMPVPQPNRAAPSYLAEG